MDVAEANRWYFQLGEWRRQQWRDWPVYKYPTDLLTYHYLIRRVQPFWLIETGTCEGGSAVFFRDMLDVCGLQSSHLVTVDVADWCATPLPPKIQRVIGSSLDAAADIAAWIAASAKELGHAPNVMVSLDSDHTAAHVAAELELYAPLVTPGSYVVVEDTMLGFYAGTTDLPTERRFANNSPWNAVQDFLAHHPEFETDTPESVFSQNPGGWLRKRPA